MLRVVGRQFAEHVVGQLIDDALSRLAAPAASASARVLRLNVDDRRQHLTDHVRLITNVRNKNTHDHN